MRMWDLKLSMPEPDRRCRLLSLCGLLLCNQCLALAAQGSYLGCFTMGDGSGSSCDAVDSTTFPPKRLGSTTLDFLGTASIPDCIARGGALGYPYIAIVNSWCFATNTTPAKVSLASSDKCNTTCQGDPTTKCGGPCSFSVYATGATSKPAVPSLSGVQPLGCFSDEPCSDIQDLYGRKMSFLGALGTPQECQRRAIQLGYAYASMQFSNECFASNVDPVLLYVNALAKCDMACEGDSTQICGGGCAHSVYRTGLKPANAPTLHKGFPANYQGCFNDISCGTASIDMIPVPPVNQTLQECQQTVLGHVYKYYAVQYSPTYAGVPGKTICVAIDRAPESIFGPAVPDDQCDVPCPGNSTVMCGGPCLVSVYQLDVASPPSPEPVSSITFTILLQASAQLASNATLQEELLTQLQANIAQIFTVNSSQVVLTFRSAGRSRMLLQALAPFAVDATVSGNTTQLQQVSILKAAPSQLADGVSSAVQLDSASISFATAGTALPTSSPAPTSPPSPPLSSPLATSPFPPSIITPFTPPAPSTSKAGIIAAAVVVPVVVLGLLLGAALWWRLRRQQQQQGHSTAESVSSVHTKLGPEALLSPDTCSGMSDACHPDAAVQVKMTQGGTSYMSSHAMAGRPRDLPAWLVPGDPFEDTACQYAWSDHKPSNAVVQVESSVNDVQLDMHAQNGSCPVLELSSADVRQQLQLVSSGLLGRGGAAVVLTCRWPARFGPNALLAAKVMTKAYPANPNILQSFAHEANLLAAIRHPHVVRLYGYCLELPTVCLIMELLPGSLEDLLYKGLCITPSSSRIPTTMDYKTQMNASGTACESRTQAFIGHSHVTPSDSDSHEAATTDHDQQQQQQQLNMVDVLRIATDVAAGLAYLHNRQVAEIGAMSTRPKVAGLNVDMMVETGMPTGLQDAHIQDEQNAKVVHRDLKPANILITSQGRAKISDFGLAREYATTTVHTVHVGAGTMIYQAPELLSGHTGPHAVKPTNRCDVYSLGIMMWELLAREKPWRGLTVGQLVSQVCAKKRPPIPITSTASGSQQQAVHLSDQPASFEALPELVDLIRACWRHRDLKRPTAAEVHERLCHMLERPQQQSVVLPVQHAAAT